jgi:hypothetical protein
MTFWIPVEKDRGADGSSFDLPQALPAASTRGSKEGVKPQDRAIKRVEESPTSSMNGPAFSVPMDTSKGVP